MINYQGQMYGVVKTFGGGRRVDRYEDEFLRNMEVRKNNNINVSINIDVNEVLSTIFKYIGGKCNHEDTINEVPEEEPELIEGIYFK